MRKETDTEKAWATLFAPEWRPDTCPRRALIKEICVAVLFGLFATLVFGLVFCLK